MNVMRKIFGPVKENGVWMIRNNRELVNRYGEPSSFSEIRKGRLRLLRHMESLPEEKTVKKVFKNIQEGEEWNGKPRNIWMDDVKHNLKKMGVKRLQKSGYGWRRLENEPEGGQRP
jgi:hypothetical protein